ncbi:alpha-N-arabinofuranosidase A [Aspergillus heterothallicus]
MKFDFARLLTSIPGLDRIAQHDDPGLTTRQNPSVTAPINLTVLPDGGNETSSLLHGIMFEEMDHSGDGGIHGQLLVNNGFQGWDPGLTGYKPLGDVSLYQDIDNPLTDSIACSLGVNVPRSAKGLVGFANTGYKGVPVQNVEYRCSFWMMGDYTGDILLRLVGTRSGTVYAARNLSVRGDWGSFRWFETRFDSRAAADGENEWQLWFDAAGLRGSVLNFGLVQLFPPTYNNRTNGLRDDVAREVAALKPAFLRFPGGNNIEGLDIGSRWKWNETIGPLENRLGRQGDWHYPNTEALGLDEYLWWCEDMEMEPILTVWDGKSYGGIIAGDDIQPYLDDILHELEYLLGPSTSHYGAMRARNGRRQPWTINYIEIGNEDDYTGGCDTYTDRLTPIYKTIHTHYPNITLIANNIEEACLPATPIPNLMYDYHYYRNPDDLAAMFDLWDHWNRSKPIIVGEYGCRNYSNPDGVFWSFVRGSCAEAVHMIGLERNSDVVRMAAYAPLLQHFGFTQWSPTLLGLDSSPNSLTLSTSYFVQRMFSTNRGNYVHRVRSTHGFGPVYWVATSNATSYQVKLANYGEEQRTVIVHLPADSGRGTLETISGPQDASNFPHNVTITPDLVRFSARSDVYTVFLEPWAVAVLVVSY